MKKPSRFLRLLGAGALLATLLASVFATPVVFAGDPDPDPSDDGAIGDIWDGETEPSIQLGAGGIYFPWVGNDDESAGLGPADTSTSVMNLSDAPAIVFAFVGTHDTAELPDTGGWDLVGPFFLAPWASKTFTAAELGIAEGAGAPVTFSGYNELRAEGGTCEENLGGPLEAGNDVNGNGECTDVEVYVGSANDDPTDPALCWVDNANGDPAPTYNEAVDGGVDAAGGLNNDGDCQDAEQGSTGGTVIATSTVLAGYAKQAVDGENLPYTTAADTSVSGYNSIGGFELGEFDDWYFPIAQTNCGPGGCWNSVLRIANFGQVVGGEIDSVGSAAVTARFFPSDDGSGSLAEGFQLQALVNTGDVWEIDISDYVPEGWVGSVHVFSDSAVFAMVDRVKIGYSAWITNTASNAPFTNANNVEGGLGQYVLFAPDVRTDFFGWNTGINVANLVNEDNNINIQYFNAFGNAPQTLTQRLAPQGMTYFYDPSQAPQDGSVQDPTADVNSDIIGSALIWSDAPVAVAVDATKYPESTTSEDPNIFQTMSYNATGNVFTTQAFPLVQKGNPTDGMGATSGINIMNPNSNAAQATVTWVNPSGFGADNFGTSAVAIPGFANGFVYTMTQGNLPNGFYGSAVLNSTLPVSAVTTQVDYQVEWDGTAVWLGYNPCGNYRDSGDLGVCNFGDPFAPGGDSGTVTKTFVDDTGAPITGAEVHLVNEAFYEQVVMENESFQGVPWDATGVSDVNGEVSFSTVPVGTYFLAVASVPQNEDEGNVDAPSDQFSGAGDVEGPFDVNGGEDVVIENVLDRILATKTVMLGDDAVGVEVCLHEDADDSGDLGDDEEANPAVCDVAGGAGNVEFTDVEPGTYLISVNFGIENDAVAEFSAQVFGPETFELGGVYVNDLVGAIEGAEGDVQKVLTLPEDVTNDILAGDASISGLVQFIDPDGEVEAEGQFQTAVAEPIGPNDELSFSTTDLSVPAGGPYTVEVHIVITLADGEVITIDETITEQDGHAVCAEFLDPTSECELANGELIVTEDMVTRAFNVVNDNETP